MRKYDVETVTEEQKRLKSLTCDRCGKEVPFEYEENNPEVVYNREARADEDVPGKFTAEFGFNSDLDGDEWLAELCHECTIAVFDFINYGKGPGTRISNLWGWPEPYSTEYLSPPYNLDKLSMREGFSWKCKYHPELGTLILSKEGLECRKSCCPTLFEHIPEVLIEEKKEEAKKNKGKNKKGDKEEKDN